MHQTPRQIHNVRISADGGQTWHPLGPPSPLQFSADTPPSPSSYRLDRAFSVTIESTRLSPSAFLEFFRPSGLPQRRRPQRPEPAWPNGARAAARRQRKRRAKALQKRQRHA